MESIVWKSDYDTGIKEIDEQHRKLVDLLHDLQEVAFSSSSNGDIGTRLLAFIKYMKVHLKDEESLMRRIAYSDYELHKQQHTQLISQFVSLLQKLKSGDELTPTALIEFMRHWLINHIEDEDSKIGVELRERLDTASLKSS